MHVARLHQVTRPRASQHPGTFAGVIEKIPYLQVAGRHRRRAAAGLRVRRDTRSAQAGPTAQPLRNYWGYSTVGFFAPHSALLPSPEEGCAPARVPRHGQGAAQGGHRGHPRRGVQPHQRGQPRTARRSASRGWTTSVYYHLVPNDRQYYMDYSGLRQHGQRQPPGRRRSASSSACEYWVREMPRRRLPLRPGLGPLARPRTARRWPTRRCIWNIELSEDPGRDEGHRRGVGRRRALPGRLLPGRALGEWNGRYRDDIRRFLRGDAGHDRRRRHAHRRLATTSTSPSGQLPINSINFITCHDGFTLNDLV